MINILGVYLKSYYGWGEGMVNNMGNGMVRPAPSTESVEFPIIGVFSYNRTIFAESRHGQKE